MMNPEYVQTVRLLLAVVPEVFDGGHFALKGGTAINLFLRDMPRLSVDLDLLVRDHALTRHEAFELIASQMDRMKSALMKSGCICEIGATRDGNEVKLFVQRNRQRVKVEVNHVFRGAVLPVENRELSPKAQELFQTRLQIPVLHTAELYGSKLVAAMDRQHPRDLFDVLSLYAGEGLSAEMIECFVCYVAGHNRPVHEVLSGNRLNIEPAFVNEFAGMADSAVALLDLIEVREKLFTDLPRRLSAQHRQFLLGLVNAAPDWSLMTCPHLAALPAIAWRLTNLRKLKKSNPKKFEAQAKALEKLFADD
jgi:predicted nucleotidyltransferase component of viral defense system